jgi:hypothetical protein
MSEVKTKEIGEDRLKKIVKVAVLDSQDALIGTESMTRSQAQEQGKIVLPPSFDLPTNGTYKWVKGIKAFYPLGFGFAKPTRPPVDRDHAFYALIRMLQAQGIGVGEEAQLWADWFKDNDLRRNEEMQVKTRRARPLKGARDQ